MKLQQLLSSITPGQFEGVLLYVIGAISSTIVKLHYRKPWSRGLMGTNMTWESPEVLLVILFIFFDHLIMAHVFLKFHISDSVLWFMAGLFLYGFTGRWGLEWIASLKGGGTTTIINKSSASEETITKKDPE